MTKLKFLHFADSHIDAVQSGRWDPETGLPIRAMDFLKSLDTIVDAAIQEKVDLVLFAGDAYKDRNPTPQYQAEFASRILKLEDAKIPTYLLVGNHDMGASMKAHALTEFKTFNTEYIQVMDEVDHIKSTWGPGFDLITLPWIHKSKLELDDLIFQLDDYMDEMDPTTPNIFLGHCSIAGAMFSSERLVMLGEDLILPLRLLIESPLDYAALGHIHKRQDLNPDRLPDGKGCPIVYPGSIERVDWGEAGEPKGYALVEIEKGSPTKVEYVDLPTRPMNDFVVSLTDKEHILDEIREQVGESAGLDFTDQMVRTKLQYPENWAGLISNQAIEGLFPKALSIQVIHDPIRESRARLDLDQDVAAYSPSELLSFWMEEKGVDEKQSEILMAAALDMFGEVTNE